MLQAEPERILPQNPLLEEERKNEKNK